MSEWRYIATRMNGDGTETFLSYEVPLGDVSIQESLSGHGGIDASISPEVLDLKDKNNRPIFVPWSTAIYAEASGQIRGGGILTTPVINGPKIDLDCIGHTGYFADQPWPWEDKYDKADPLVIDRYLVDKFQTQKHFNIGLKATGAKESQMVRLSETVSGKNELYYIAAWQTADLDRERTQLAEAGGYEWVVGHRWSGEKILHELEYGYPRIGKRRTDLTFIVGENIIVDPTVTEDGEEYASHALVLGAGQGRKMVRAEASSSTKRLGRWKVVTDKNLGKKDLAQKRATATLAALAGELDVTSVEVWDSPNARIGSYRAGDEILIQSSDRGGWSDFGDLWVRILGITHHPEKNTSTLQIRRTEKIT